VRTKGLAIFALSLTMISATANADDSVKVKFRSGYPPPDRNSEMVELKVLRFAVGDSAVPIDVDRYFTKVGKILADERVPASWQYVPVDDATIEIDVALGDKSFTLLFGAMDVATVSPYAEDEDKRVLSACRQLLKLTMEEASRTFSGK